MTQFWDGSIYLARPLDECVSESRRLAQRAVALDDADATGTWRSA